MRGVRSGEARLRLCAAMQAPGWFEHSSKHVDEGRAEGMMLVWGAALGIKLTLKLELGLGLIPRLGLAGLDSVLKSDSVTWVGVKVRVRVRVDQKSGSSQKSIMDPWSDIEKRRLQR